ncbi:MAG: DUF6273 domain-containing protein, partial [Bacteroidales bacterium]|nr:DUF6273 domain-containing protein [Bacteroidales bacterium]
MDVKQLEINGEEYKIKDEGARDTTAANLSPCTGRNLTELFADEIAEYSDPWAWIKARINDANWQGLANGDYIPMEVDGETHEMQINIDTYYAANCGNNNFKTKHHIDFISRDCYCGTHNDQYVMWQEDGSNNGDSSTRYPYMRSTVKEWLCETLFYRLPDEAQAVITSRKACVEQRYSSSGDLTESNSWTFQDIGKLWIPDEYEVYGQVLLATPYYSNICSIQYPVFRDGWNARCKGYAPGKSADYWWLRSVYAGNSNSAV